MTYDPTFEAAMAQLFVNEGGYVNDPSDAGGETKYGISKASYPNLDIKNLTQDQAKDIYYKDWWAKYGYSQFSDAHLAIKVFNTAVNLGASRANKILQRCLNINGYPNIVDDGNLGPITLKAINACDGTTILSVYRQAQANYYRAVVLAHPEDAKFLNGWLTRSNQ